MEDLCSVLDLRPQAKYDATMERVARNVRALSTSAAEDVLLILKRALFAWLIADGDMHLKNMALMKTADPGSEMFRAVRVAPLYDAVTTRVFPRLERGADFRAMANTAGSQAGPTAAAIDQMVQRIAAAARSVALPAGPKYGREGGAIVGRMIELCRTRAETFE